MYSHKDILDLPVHSGKTHYIRDLPAPFGKLRIFGICRHSGFAGNGGCVNPFGNFTGVYKYIPTDELQLKNERAKMYEAGFAFLVRTREAIDDALKW